IFWGMAVSMLLRWVERPLGEMAAQAEAVGEGRFRILQEPAVLELRSRAKALNRMSGRVQSLFSEQASRIEALHNESSVDPVTGLLNRSAFMGELRQALTDVAGPPSGCLAVVKLDDLAALNRQFGRERTDLWLLSLARRLQGRLLVAPGTTLARLSGAEFAWLAPGMTVVEAQAQLAAPPALGGLEEEGQERPSVQIHVGGAAYERGDAVSELLARVDLALMRAETTGDPVLDGGEGRLPEQTPGAEAWSSLLQAAVNDQIFALEGYPVLQAGGALIHREYMLRLPWKGHLLSAGQFMPAAVRLGLAGACDLEALRLGMGRLAALPEDRIALNLAPQSLTEDGFLDRLDILLATAGESARRISVEVSERGLDASLSGIEPLAEVLGRHGVGLGIEHFGRQLAALPRLYTLRLAYLKLDGSIVAGLPDHEGQQRLVKAIVDVARGLEIPVYAGQVHTAGEWDMARRLGVSGMTGPEASRRASAP
ncbi:EAL domain-containing protein, partial [Zoogloea sp.]|uniref:EAL domain-containing protein n=1 Tax=Zoogloea sp. TaxID=49181 RepID=UPI0026281AA1